MAITVETIVERIDVSLPMGFINLREVSQAVEDDVVRFSSPPTRRVINPGDDVSGEDELVQDIAALVHTTERVDAYLASIAPEEEEE